MANSSSPTGVYEPTLRGMREALPRNRPPCKRRPAIRFRSPSPQPPSVVHRFIMVYLIGLGTNRWPRLTHMYRALEHLKDLGQIQGISRLYLTEPWGMPPGTPFFFNACLQMEGPPDPESLLEATQAIERTLGRRREEKGRLADRTIDLDLLARNGPTRGSNAPRIPHPRLTQRRFVLLPLCDIARDWMIGHPLHASIQALLEHCPDPVVPLPLQAGDWPFTRAQAPVPPECEPYPGVPG